MALEQVKRIAVVGLGRMGHGIAQAFATAGYTVRGFDEAEAARRSLHDCIGRNLREFVEHDLIAAADVAPTLDRVTVAESEEAAVADADFVVEAIAEQLDAKQAFFARVEQAAPEHAILASNSSTFTISQAGTQMQSTSRAIVTHWFNPPHIVPTVEVVPGPQTGESVIETTLELHRKIGKLAVRVNGELPGFLVNRVQVAMIREVWDLYERGVASREDIDAALRGSLGFRLAACGPLAVCDFGGLDIWAKVYTNLAPELRADCELPAGIAKLVADGRCGTRTAAGIHDYDPEQLEQLTSDRDSTFLKLARLLHRQDSSQD